MKSVLSFALTIMMALPAFAQSGADDNTPLRGVVCGKDANTGKYVLCTAGELKTRIHLLKEAKAQGDQLKQRKSAQQQVGETLLIVGGTWFSAAAITDVVVSNLPWTTEFLLQGHPFLSTAASYAFIGGVTVAPAMAVLGGFVLMFTPRRVEPGTLTAYFAQDENFGKLLNYDESQIFALASEDSVLAEKIIVVSSILLSEKMK